MAEEQSGERVIHRAVKDWLHRQGDTGHGTTERLRTGDTCLKSPAIAKQAKVPHSMQAHAAHNSFVVRYLRRSMRAVVKAYNSFRIKGVWGVIFRFES